MQIQWFESWFDSPWYPILYSHRDHSEAEGFISRLLSALHPVAGSRFLDLACGRGRHARYIHAHGYEVTGYDLSAASIADARETDARSGLHFEVHDMREPFEGRFDYILNLFTSFGYFADRGENLKVLQNVTQALSAEGTFVLDFLNLPVILQKMVPTETVTKQGIEFKLTRRLEDGVLLKTIDFEDGGKPYHFEERVQALDMAHFEELLDAAGLQITMVWGDYAGGSYQEATSPRLILFARKRLPNSKTTQE